MLERLFNDFEQIRNPAIHYKLVFEFDQIVANQYEFRVIWLILLHLLYGRFSLLNYCKATRHKKLVKYFVE